MSWFWRFGRRKEELQEEIDTHLQMAIADRVGRGESEQAARQAALRDLGNVPLIEDVTRRTWGWLWLEELLLDLSYAVRLLRKSPGFTAVVVLILALGIGANTAIFTLVDTVLLRPLPYKDASRLMWATERFPSDAGAANVVSPDFMAWKDNNHVFEQVGASGGAGNSNLTGASQAVRVSVRNVTTNYFPMLGMRPFLGRTFVTSEGKLGSDHVALLSESLWRNPVWQRSAHFRKNGPPGRVRIHGTWHNSGESALPQRRCVDTIRPERRNVLSAFTQMDPPDGHWTIKAWNRSHRGAIRSSIHHRTGGQALSAAGVAISGKRAC